MTGPRITPEIGAFLLECGSRRSLDFDAIASMVAERFPCRRRISAAEIATHLGRKLGGRSSLNRLQKDRELAAWLRHHKDDGRVVDILAACRAKFGADRVPSKTRVAEFIRSEGRRGRQNRLRILDQDQELAEWVKQASTTRMVTELFQECVERFGAARTPTRSAFWRLLKSMQPGRRPRPLKVVADPELGAWLRAKASRLTLAECHARCIELFGQKRAPSVSAIQRFLVRLPGVKLTRRKGVLDRDLEIAAWVWERRTGRTFYQLAAEVLAEFGIARSPSRSGLHRYLVAVRRGAVQCPTALPQRGNAEQV